MSCFFCGKSISCCTKGKQMSVTQCQTFTKTNFYLFFLKKTLFKPISSSFVLSWWAWIWHFRWLSQLGFYIPILKKLSRVSHPVSFIVSKCSVTVMQSLSFFLSFFFSSLLLGFLLHIWLWEMADSHHVDSLNPVFYVSFFLGKKRNKDSPIHNQSLIQI